MKDKWLIWSREHQGWWLPGHKGYIQNRDQAGRYPLQEAMTICEQANKYLKPTDPPQETFVYADLIPNVERPAAKE